MIRGTQTELMEQLATLNRETVESEETPIVNLGNREEGFLGWSLNPLEDPYTFRPDDEEPPVASSLPDCGYLDGDRITWFNSDKTLYAVWKPGQKFHRTIIWWSDDENDRTEWAIKGKLTKDLLVLPEGRSLSDAVKVKIGVSVSEIGEETFQNCRNIKSVTLGNGLKTIGDYAFYDCSKLTKIIIPNGVTSIGDRAFYNCTGLINISMPNSMEKIGQYAFYQCFNLTDVVIPEGVTTIDQWAFYLCSHLKSLSLPNSIESLGNGAFASCTALERVTIPQYVCSQSLSNSLIFRTVNNLKIIVIQNGATSIADNFCKGLVNLTSVTIPATVTNIGYRAFMDCSGIKSIKITGNVKTIGGWAFYACYGLSDIHLENGIETIGERAF